MKYLALFFIPLLVFSGSMTRTFTYSPYDLNLTKLNGYDLISMGNYLWTSEAGNPQLPEMEYKILVPPTAEITGIKILSYKVKEIPGSFNIFPAQPALPLSQIHNGTEFVRPNPEVYNSHQAYPEKIVNFTPTGCMSGYRIGGISIYPVQYIPNEKQIRLYTEITVRIEYEEGRHEMISLSKGQVEFFAADVRNMVINPEDIDRFSPGIKPLFRDSTDYLIITGPTYLSYFQPIANWRSKKGYYVKVLGTDSVYARYAGRDNAEKVRNCIIDYWQNKGVKWVLLAGDVSVVPHRTCYVNTGSTTDYIPCDLYFADLQWSWDGNRNNVFGEFPFNGDTVDLYYDVYIGRGSIDDATQANTFVRKDTVYEKRPDPNYMVRMFLPQGNLWSNWLGDSVQQMISRYPPSPPWVIRKMYERDGQLSRTACTETLRTGVGLCHLVGHGDASGVYGGYGTWIYSSGSDVNGLTNAGKYIIANSIACHSGAFDSECYAEYFVIAPNGGAVATIFNSRYGWGSPGSVGYSEDLNRRFYQNFFQTDTTNFEIGKVHALSKHPYRNSAYSQGVWRWIYYELNLFGDPELPIWSRTPLTLTVTHPSSIGRGLQNYTVTVRSAGNPLQRALVCLWKGDEVYARGTTDANGNVTLSINPTTAGSMSVTVTAKSHYPYEGSTTVGIEEEKPAVVLSRSLRVASNPVKDRLVINYTLPEPEKVDIRLFDAAGRRVASISGTYTGVGQIVYRTDNISSGVYFVQFETKTGKTNQSVLIVK